MLFVLTSCSKAKMELKENKNELFIYEYPSYPNYYRILEKITYHGNDIEGINADKWIGLYKNSNGYYTESTEVFTRNVHDDMLDEEGKYTAKEILTSNNSRNCIALLGNFSELYWNNGEVKKPKSIDLSKQIETRKSFNFNFLDKKYNFNIKENGYITISTEIKGKMVEQLISTNSCLKRVLFAGDLNLDGKLDLILDTADCESGATNLAVFMSPRDGEFLFELEALHHSTSC